MTTASALAPSPSDENSPSSASTTGNQVRLRVVDPAEKAASTTVDGPPPWLEELIYHVQGPEGVAGVELGFLKRLARSVMCLPPTTPHPDVGIGDDGSVVLEWDFDRAHFGIQVDPDREYDAAFVDFDGDDEVTEAPLSSVLGVIAQLFAHMASAN